MTRHVTLLELFIRSPYFCQQKCSVSAPLSHCRPTSAPLSQIKCTNTWGLPACLAATKPGYKAIVHKWDPSVSAPRDAFAQQNEWLERLKGVNCCRRVAQAELFEIITIREDKTSCGARDTCSALFNVVDDDGDDGVRMMMAMFHCVWVFVIAICYRYRVLSATENTLADSDPRFFRTSLNSQFGRAIGSERKCVNYNLFDFDI